MKKYRKLVPTLVGIALMLAASGAYACPRARWFALGGYMLG